MQPRQLLLETAVARDALLTSGGLSQTPCALLVVPRLRLTAAGCGHAGPVRRGFAGGAPLLSASRRLQNAPAVRVRRAITAARRAKGSPLLGLTTDADAITAPLAWPTVNGAMPARLAAMRSVSLVLHLVYVRSGWPRPASTHTQATDGTVDNYSGQPPSTAMIDDFLVGEREQAEEAAGRSALLTLLRTVPSTFAVAPRLWVPRQVRQQAGATLRGLIAGAAATANAPPGDVNAEIAHLLCRAGPQLLLRYPPEKRDAEEVPDSVIGPGAIALLRGRLIKARAGDWQGLIGDLLADLAAQPGATARARPEARDAKWSHQQCHCASSHRKGQMREPPRSR